MPRYMILRKSGVHRAACFALYRALLRQKRELQLNEHQQQLFRNQIWVVFMRNTRLQSPLEISIALRLGYETLEGLHDGTRQQHVLDHILGLASTPNSNARPEKSPSLTQAKTVRPDNAPKLQSAPYPGAARTLDRPYQNLSGHRHVPTLVNANRVPFLRIKKPQPPFLSRIIRNTIETRNHRILAGNRLANELAFAQDEEEWDRILYELADLEPRNLLEPCWHHEIKRAIDDNQQHQVAAIQKRADVSAKMHAIVEKEEALAQEEKLRRRDEKHKAYKARRLARKGLGDSEIQEGLDSQTEKTVILDASTMTEDVLIGDQQELQPPFQEEVTHDKPTMAKEVFNEGQQEVRQPFGVEVTLKKLTTTDEALNQGEQEARPPFRGEVYEAMTTEEVLNKDRQVDRPTYREEVPFNKVTTTKEVMDQGRQEDRSPYTDEKSRTKPRRLITPDELNWFNEFSLPPDEFSLRPKTEDLRPKMEDLRPKTEEEIKVKAAMTRIKVEKSERKAEERKRTQEAARMKQQVDEEVKERRMDTELKPEVLAMLEEPRFEWSMRRDINPKPEVLPQLEEPWREGSERRDTELPPKVLLQAVGPRRVWSGSRVDRGAGLKLDVLCQRLFESSFRMTERNGLL